MKFSDFNDFRKTVFINSDRVLTVEMDGLLFNKAAKFCIPALDLFDTSKLADLFQLAELLYKNYDNLNFKTSSYDNHTDKYFNYMNNTSLLIKFLENGERSQLAVV